MSHAVTQPTPPFPIADGLLEVHQIPAWEDNLIWLLVDPKTRLATAVDGPEAAPVLEYCEAQGLVLDGILNTHTHRDHVGINHDLEDRGLIMDLRVVGCRTRVEDIPGITVSVDEGDVVQVGPTEGLVLRTEGHIDGHLSFVFDGAVFCGDTMFGGGCGRLFDGPPHKMLLSLQRLAQLPDDTLVCCAHEYTEDNLRFASMLEPDNTILAHRIKKVCALRAEGKCSVPSTIAEERATNPFLRTDSPALVHRLRELMPSHDLSDPVAILTATRALKDTAVHREMPATTPPV